MSDILEDMIYRRTLSCGTIQVTRDQGEVSLDDLFDIAERRNPKRAFLFVSKSTRQAHSRATLSHAAGLQTACQPVPLDTDRTRTVYRYG